MTRKGWIVTIAVFVAALGIVLIGKLAGDPAPDIAPLAKTQIDRLAAEGDCVGLQAWFDATNDASQLSYIDDKMEDADCYGD